MRWKLGLLVGLGIAFILWVQLFALQLDSIPVSEPLLVDDEVFTLAPTANIIIQTTSSPSSPHLFSSYFLSSTSTKDNQLISNFIVHGWKEDENASLLLLPGKSSIEEARQLFPFAWINVFNSDCLWGNAKLACLTQHAGFDINRLVHNKLFGCANKPTPCKNLQVDVVRVFFPSAFPFLAHVLLPIHKELVRETECFLAILKRSLKFDVYRGMRSFQGVELHFLKTNRLLVNIIPNPQWDDIAYLAEFAMWNSSILVSVIVLNGTTCHFNSVSDAPGLVGFAAQPRCQNTSHVRFGSLYSSSPSCTSSRSLPCSLSQVSNVEAMNRYPVPSQALKCPPRQVTWEEANQFCLQAGARLCTKDELTGQAMVSTTRSTPTCYLDYYRVWTSTRCAFEPRIAYWTSKGGGKNYDDVFQPLCVFAKEPSFLPLKISARCCADKVIPHCLPETHQGFFQPSWPVFPTMNTNSSRSLLSCSELLFPLWIGEEVCMQRNRCHILQIKTSWEEAYHLCVLELGARLCTEAELKLDPDACEVWTTSSWPRGVGNKKAIRCCGDRKGRYE